MSSLPDYWTQEYLHARKNLRLQSTPSAQDDNSTSTTASTSSPTSTSISISSEKTENYSLQRLNSLKINYQTQSNKQPFIIGVAGGSASGKTTVCHEIVKALANKRVVVFSQDSFYKNLSAEEKQLASQNDYDFDHPDAFEFELLEETIRKLKQGKSVQIPVYDFKTHSRKVGESIPIIGGDVIIIEGILTFYAKSLRDLFDMKIFVDTDADTRLVRRIYRDIKERGRDLVGVLTQYERFVKPSFDDYVMPTKKYADIIIPRGGANHVAIDLLVQHVKVKLMEMDKAALGTL